MNLSRFRKYIFETVIILVISLVFVLGGIYLSSSRKEERKQVDYRQQFSQVMPSDHYSLIKSPILDNYDQIDKVYIGYDASDTPLGYVVDVKCRNEYGYELHMLVGIDYESATIKGITHIRDEEIPISFSDSQFGILRDTVSGKRIPMALTGSVAEEDSDTGEEIVINGLHDGIYYAQSPVKDSSGYIDYVEIEIEQGRISHVRWDAVNLDRTTENRSEASLSGAYRITGLDWATQSYNMSHALIEVQDPKLLNMKSDGTTAVVEGVTCDIRKFVELSTECIDYARSGYRKADYLEDLDVVLNHILRGSAESLGLLDDNGIVVISFDKYLGPFEIKNSDGVVIGLRTVRDLARSYTEGEDTGHDSHAVPDDDPDITSVPEMPDDVIDGSEDGVINENSQSDNSLTESIDDLPLTEIASYIDSVPGAGASSKLAVTCINTCYKFMKDYLNWLV